MDSSTRNVCHHRARATRLWLCGAGGILGLLFLLPFGVFFASIVQPVRIQVGRSILVLSSHTFPRTAANSGLSFRINGGKSPDGSGEARALWVGPWNYMVAWWPRGSAIPSSARPPAGRPGNRPIRID